MTPTQSALGSLPEALPDPEVLLWPGLVAWGWLVVPLCVVLVVTEAVSPPAVDEELFCVGAGSKTQALSMLPTTKSESWTL